MNIYSCQIVLVKSGGINNVERIPARAHKPASCLVGRNGHSGLVSCKHVVTGSHPWCPTCTECCLQALLSAISGSTRDLRYTATPNERGAMRHEGTEFHAQNSQALASTLVTQLKPGGWGALGGDPHPSTACCLPGHAEPGMPLSTTGCGSKPPLPSTGVETGPIFRIFESALAICMWKEQLNFRYESQDFLLSACSAFASSCWLCTGEAGRFCM